jgi:hypothetical protein
VVKERGKGNQRRASFALVVPPTPSMRIEVGDSTTPVAELREPPAEVLLDQGVLDVLKIRVLVPVTVVSVERHGVSNCRW